MATSVLPKPTSPHTNLSIGLSLSISHFTWVVALVWSGVRSYGNESSNSLCHGPSIGYLNPFSLLLCAYNLIKSIAIFFTDFFGFSLILFQLAPPSLLIVGAFEFELLYLPKLPSWSAATLSLPSIYLITK